MANEIEVEDQQCKHDGTWAQIVGGEPFCEICGKTKSQINAASRLSSLSSETKTETPCVNCGHHKECHEGKPCIFDSGQPVCGSYKSSKVCAHGKTYSETCEECSRYYASEECCAVPASSPAAQNDSPKRVELMEEYLREIGYLGPQLVANTKDTGRDSVINECAQALLSDFDSENSTASQKSGLWRGIGVVRALASTPAAPPSPKTQDEHPKPLDLALALVADLVRAIRRWASEEDNGERIVESAQPTPLPVEVEKDEWISVNTLPTIPCRYRVWDEDWETSYDAMWNSIEEKFEQICFSCRQPMGKIAYYMPLPKPPVAATIDGGGDAGAFRAAP